MTEDSGAHVKLAAAGLIVLGTIAAAIWYPHAAPPAPVRHARTTAPSTPTSTFEQAPAPDPTMPAPAAMPAVSTASASAPAAAPPSAPPASGEPAPSASLEDMIGAAMPAVVRIETPGGFGSGFFVRRDTLLTNVHVVAGNRWVTVRQPDGRTAQGRVDATAPEFDVAVVKVADADGSSSVLTMGSGIRARVGQDIVALGSPLGLQNTVTRGIVSALRQVGPVVLVQTDAAINPGNSGGPLLDRDGRVMAIATMGVKPGEGQGLSFGVAIEHARALLEGRLTTEVNGAPIAGLSQVIAQRPARADAGDARSLGAQAFEQAVALRARDADALDDRWRSFVAVCYQGRIVGAFDRPWFALFDSRAMQGVVPVGCDGAFAEITQAAERIRDEIRAADEAARRADVFPGTRRDALRRHKLEYSGWDR